MTTDKFKSYTQIDQIPGVSVVVIGLNVEQYISSCLQSVYNLDYPRELLEVIYVDSGSKDKTLDILKRFPSVKVIKLGTKQPNAAKGRNAGWRAANHDLIQFVDADSYLDTRWLRTAIPQLKANVGAVAGILKERFPNRNLYHRMANLEWNIRIGSGGWSIKDIEAKTFGGNVLIRRNILEKTDGYQQNLAAGEDPDLSYRIRRMGYKIYRLNSMMATHDINISSLATFLKRTRRSGFVYGHLALSYWREPERYMVKRSIAILLGAAAPLFIMLLSALLGYLGPGIILSLLLMFRLVFQAGHFSKVMSIPLSDAIIYSLYLAFCIFPQFMGVMDSLRKFSLFKPRHKPVTESNGALPFNRVIQNI
mgnify:FL=1